MISKAYELYGFKLRNCKTFTILLKDKGKIIPLPLVYVLRLSHPTKVNKDCCIAIGTSNFSIRKLPVYVE